MIQRSRSLCACDTRGKYANVLTLWMRLSSFKQRTVDVLNQRNLHHGGVGTDAWTIHEMLYGTRGSGRERGIWQSRYTSARWSSCAPAPIVCAAPEQRRPSPRPLATVRALPDAWNNTATSKMDKRNRTEDE